MAPGGTSPGHVDIHQCILILKMVLKNQLLDYRDQKGKIGAGKGQMPGSVIQATDMGIRSEQSSGIMADHFIQAVAEQKSPVIHGDVDILFWHEPAVEICNHMSPFR
jgi:hypothetical protein